MCLKQNRLQLGDSQEGKRYTFRRCGVRAVIALGVTSAGVRGSDDLISANCVFPGKETRPCPHHYQAPHSQYPGLFHCFSHSRSTAVQLWLPARTTQHAHAQHTVQSHNHSFLCGQWPSRFWRTPFKVQKHCPLFCRLLLLKALF